MDILFFHQRIFCRTAHDDKNPFQGGCSFSPFSFSFHSHLCLSHPPPQPPLFPPPPPPPPLRHLPRLPLLEHSPLHLPPPRAGFEFPQPLFSSSFCPWLGCGSPPGLRTPLSSQFLFYNQCRGGRWAYPCQWGLADNLCTPQPRIASTCFCWGRTSHRT